MCFRNVVLASFLHSQENVCPVTVMGIPTSAWTALDSVWYVKGTDHFSRISLAL